MAQVWNSLKLSKNAFYQSYHIIKTQKPEFSTQLSTISTVAHADTYVYEDGDFLVMWTLFPCHQEQLSSLITIKPENTFSPCKGTETHAKLVKLHISDNLPHLCLHKLAHRFVNKSYKFLAHQSLMWHDSCTKALSNVPTASTSHFASFSTKQTETKTERLSPNADNWSQRSNVGAHVKANSLSPERKEKMSGLHQRNWEGNLAFWQLAFYAILISLAGIHEIEAFSMSGTASPLSLVSGGL